MKVSVIWSSPNKDGLTNTAAKQFMKGLSNAGVTVKEIWLNSAKLDHCKACGNGWGNCRKDGKCVLPALERAGEVYADRLENGFDMYY